ncbi:MAG: Carboxypeptidase regulatory-like domain [Alphaproteobacteria bacterium]|jgi:hypothetical protein|nr:Carboxypeptidase regulatory-like domain [Alphaproteobacteria bacterium]
MSFRAFGPLLCGGFLLFATAAFAVQGDPVGGIGVEIESSPGGIIIAQGTTNGSGDYVFNNVPPGNYKIKVLNGRDAGKVLKTIKLTTPGSISGRLPKPSTAPGAQ